jgi:hypothetical protein
MRTLSEHIMDIVQNSVRAEATLIEVIVEESKINNLCFLTITDNGCGMDNSELQQAANPFFTSRKTRKVGLGISLLKQNAGMAGGELKIDSSSGEGTTVSATFGLSHIDKPPLGDVWETLYQLWLSYPGIELNYRHKTDAGDFQLGSNDLKEVLGEVSLQQKEIRNGIIELIKSNLNEIETTK